VGFDGICNRDGRCGQISSISVRGDSGDYPLQGQVFADNLPVPQYCTLTVTADVEHTTLTLEELCAK
jgi:hypothetical protein